MGIIYTRNSCLHNTFHRRAAVSIPAKEHLVASSPPALSAVQKLICNLHSNFHLQNPLKFSPVKEDTKKKLLNALCCNKRVIWLSCDRLTKACSPCVQQDRTFVPVWFSYSSYFFSEVLLLLQTVWWPGAAFLYVIQISKLWKESECVIMRLRIVKSV